MSGVMSETESNPSVDSFLPLPGVREKPSTLAHVPVHQGVDIPAVNQHGKE